MLDPYNVFQQIPTRLEFFLKVNKYKYKRFNLENMNWCFSNFKMSSIHIYCKFEIT